jgi:hypothetical protein
LFRIVRQHQITDALRARRKLAQIHRVEAEQRTSKWRLGSGGAISGVAARSSFR